MSITTVQNVKDINGITVSTYDTAIEAQILIVQEKVHEYTNNSFVSSTKGLLYPAKAIGRSNNLFVSDYNRDTMSRGYEGYDIANINAVSVSAEFVFDSTGKTITASNSTFSDFAATDSILICNSSRNNAYLTITSLTDTVLTVSEDIISETSTADIFLIVYPKMVSYSAARMVGWDVLKRDKATGVESERIGSYSGKYLQVGGMGYPKDIVQPLKKFILHSFK